MLQVRLVDVSRVESAPFPQDERDVGDAGEEKCIWETAKFLDVAEVGGKWL